MKARKTWKVIGIIFAVLLAVIAVVLLITTARYHIQLNQAVEALDEKGYRNLVSAGDCDVNVYSCGNENGDHTIIAMAGYLDCEMFLGWRQMTAPLEEDNRIVFVDRAGYGLSDDCKEDMTTELIVEQYRTALENAGVPKPYVLMPHSIGGVYATYWMNTYPEEIEAVMIIDGSEIQPCDPDEDMDLGIVKLVMYAGRAGLLDSMIRSEYANELATLPEDVREHAMMLLAKTMASDAATVEILNFNKNVRTAWDSIKTNDIPKMYLNVSSAFYTKEDLLAEGWTADELREYALAVEEDTDDAYYSAYLDTLAQSRVSITTYAEKMGNCRIIELPGQHEIMFDKPDECGAILKEFMDTLDTD